MPTFTDQKLARNSMLVKDREREIEKYKCFVEFVEHKHPCSSDYIVLSGLKFSYKKIQVLGL